MMGGAPTNGLRAQSIIERLGDRSRECERNDVDV